MRCCAAILALLPFSFITGGEPAHLRYIEFRDGSVLRLPVVDEEWKITLIKPNGAVDESRIRSTSLQNVVLTSEPGFDKKRGLLALVQQLASEDFRERERAQAELAKQGAAIRADLETCRQFINDSEARSRLKQILDHFADLPPPPARPGPIFDVFTLKEPSWGYLGAQGITVLVDGKPHRIARQHIHGLSASAPAGFVIPGTVSSASDVRRIGLAEFPLDFQEEAFEKAPDGRPLRIGENIEKVFVAKGFTLSTSIATSWVSVNNFQVSGKSKGMSVATHLPLWEGEITIRFCQPGRENIAAGVTHFGCYLAAVMPNGTAMIAYDAQGRQLGIAHTQNNGHEFLGIASPVPMHRIRIVPNLANDKDYTLDDFIFSPPVTSEAADPKKCIAQLLSGERIVCSDVAFTQAGVRLFGMPGDLPERVVPRAELVRVNAPDKKTHVPPGIFAELRDGSLLFARMPADKPGRPVFSHKPALFQETNHLVALWSSEYPRMLPPDNRPRQWNSEKKTWEPISDVRFDEQMVAYKQQDQDRVAAYGTLAPLWLSLPADTPAPGTWRIRTRLGEEFIINQPEQMMGKLSEGLTTQWQGRALRLDGGEIAAVMQFMKQK